MAVSYQDQLDDLSRRLNLLERQNALQLDQVVHRAVDESKRKVFADFGVDIDDPKQLQEFQQSLIFNQNIHKGINKALGALLLAICGMLGTAFTMIVMGWIENHGK
jgi:hypothetical protein